MRTGIHFHGKLKICEIEENVLTITIRISEKQATLIKSMGFSGAHYGSKKPEVEITIATE